MSFKTENARAKTEEIRQLKDLFSLYDNDASGTINKMELKIRDPRTGRCGTVMRSNSARLRTAPNRLILAPTGCGSWIPN